MEPSEQLYHLHNDIKKQNLQLQKDAVAGFDYLRKRAEHSERRVQQAGTFREPPMSAAQDRGWDTSTRQVTGALPAHNAQNVPPPFPPGLPASLRNIVIRQQHMEARWHREFSARLRQASEEHSLPRATWSRNSAEQGRDKPYKSDQAGTGEGVTPQQRPLASTHQSFVSTQGKQTPQSARAKGRGWQDSTRSFDVPSDKD